MMSSNKRNIKRLRQRLQIKFGAEGPSRFGFTEDISSTGIFIKSAIVQNPNTLLQIEISAPAGEIIRLTGRVMWAKKVPPNLLQRVKGGMGIRITAFQDGEDVYRRICAELEERYA